MFVHVLLAAMLQDGVGQAGNPDRTSKPAPFDLWKQFAPQKKMVATDASGNPLPGYAPKVELPSTPWHWPGAFEGRGPVS